MARLIIPWLYSALGWTLLVLGILFVPTPLPIGLLLMLMGLALLAHSSRNIRVLLYSLRMRWPWFNDKLYVSEERLPAIFSKLLQETRPRV